MSSVLPKLKRVLPLLAILLALALPLMFLLEDFMRDAIVLPLAYLGWLIGVILDALPQALFLTVIVAMGIYIALRSLSRERPSESVREVQSHRSEGAVALWLKRLERVSEGAYSRERLNYYLGQLLTRTIAHEQHMAPKDVLRAVDIGELTLPAEIQIYIDLAYRRGYPTLPKWYRRLGTFILRALTRQTAREATPRELERQIEPALDYIQHQLRIASVEATSEHHT